MIEVAHGILPGGPGTTLLVTAGALFAMAVYLFATKGPPRTVLVLALLAIAIAVGGVAAPDDVHDVRLSIAAPRDGVTVPAGEDIEVRVDLSGATVQPEGSSSAHLHLSVDGEVVSMSSALTTQISLPPGEHTIEAELVSAAHRPLSPRVVDRAMVTAAQPAG